MDIIKRIFQYSQKYIKRMYIAIVLLIGLICINLLTPLITRAIVDDVIKGGMRGIFTGLLILLFVAAVVKDTIMYLRGIFFERFSQDCIYRLRNDLYTHLQGLPFAFYDKNRVGELMSRMTGDLEGIRIFLASGIPIFLESIIYYVGASIILLILNFKLGLATLIITPLIAIVARKFDKTIRPVYSEIREQQAQLNAAAQENITGVRVVKAFAREDFEIEKFKKENRSNMDMNVKSSHIWGEYFPIMDFISGATTVILVLVGGIMVGKGEVSIGTVIAFDGYLWMIINPMRMLGWIINMMAQAITSGARVFQILDTGTSIKEIASPYNPKDFNGEVTFENVSFSYSEQPVLSDINFHVPAGGTIAIMGATGSGKTSIVNLVERFYDVTAGGIYIDGEDIRNWSIRRLRSEIGIIMQETFLFSDTIEGNLLYGEPDATRGEIIRACKAADAHDFIIEMPQGYDTIIGERGVGLSGGQKQRIAIARAIIKDPKILIMDDCTSSVDMETEYKIQKALGEIMKNRTTFIIAHRISSVKNADEIIILDDCSIVERGNHQQLMDLKGRYYEMVKQQYKDLDDVEFRKLVMSC